MDGVDQKERGSLDSGQRERRIVGVRTELVYHGSLDEVEVKGW